MTAGFTREWLAMREPADRAARAPAMARAAAHALASAGVVNVVDLGCGTGANLRVLAPVLPMAQRWLLVDRDAALLAEARRAIAAWSGAHGWDARVGDDEATLRVAGEGMRLEVATSRQDLAAIERLDLPAAPSLVTASALLDLVSETWLRALVARCAARRAVALFALTYDGRIACEPPDADDEMVSDLVNRHQRTDKGFGPSVGPGAPALASALLQEAGYQTGCEQSDWNLPPEMPTLQARLVEGWARAAGDVDRRGAADIAAWRARRLAHIQAGRSRIVVGHRDVVGWPSPTVGRDPQVSCRPA
jgi:hypothetical protein